MSRARDPHTRDLFAAPEPVAVGFGAEIVGSGSVASKIARVVSRTMQDAREETGLSRERLAEAMTEALGRDVSAETLNKWASEASEAHRIPLDAFIVLIAATKSYDALGFIPAMYGYAVVENRYIDVIEQAQVREHIETLRARDAMLTAKLRGRR